MERFVCRNCRGMYERRVLSKVCEWKDSVLLRWLAALLTPQKAGSGRRGVSLTHTVHSEWNVIFFA